MKARTRNGQVFVRYSGLWGHKGRLFLTSGYWGPAFNETDATCDDGTAAYRSYFGRRAVRADCGHIFLTAWCDGVHCALLNKGAECFAASDVP